MITVVELVYNTTQASLWCQYYHANGFRWVKLCVPTTDIHILELKFDGSRKTPLFPRLIEILFESRCLHGLYLILSVKILYRYICQLYFRYPFSAEFWRHCE